MSKVEKDVVIIGCGPAGMAASIWCADLGLSHIAAEKGSAFGGQLSKIFQPITNYPGIASIDSRGLADALIGQAEAVGGDLRAKSDVISIDPNRLTVELASGVQLTTKAIVLATGVRRCRLDLAGETELEGILESGAKQAAETANARVAVVGGGDAAFENALILSKFASEVTVIHHSSRFRAREQFLEPARRDPKIRIIESAVVRELVGHNGKLKALTVDGRDGIMQIDADFLLVRTGVVPNSELIASFAKLDPKGYAVIDANCETTAAMIFAVGDVASPLAPTIPTAVGQAATAIKVIRQRLGREV